MKKSLKEPTLCEIANEIGVSKEEIAYALDAIQSPVSLYDPVYTYTRTNTSGMTRTNNVEHFKSVTYQGTVGTKYFATIAFYAEDDEGSETLYCDTNVVTAVSVAP